jgi:lactate dehydrogenase-like 2-hydroxyacid dehydrogenase
MDSNLKKLTVIGTIFKTIPQSIINNYFSVEFIPSSLAENEIAKKLASAEVCVIGGSTKITKEILDSAPALKLIGFVGTQFETSIDPKLAELYNIRIINTPGVNAWAVTEHTIALILDCLKQISYQSFYAKKGIPKKNIVSELKEAQIGIIGFGHIGHSLAKVLSQGFGSKVFYWNRTRKIEHEKALDIGYKDFDNIISDSDIIVLSIPLTQDTLNIINTREFSLMKNSAILINIARPQLVEPVALFHALHNNIIKSCAFDGYYNKFLNSQVEDPYGLLSLPDDKFILTPYTASRTHTTLAKMDSVLFDKILTYYGMES